MKNNSRILEDLKANLFELTYMLEEYNRREMMDMLCKELKNRLHAFHIVLYIQNKWQLDDQISHFASEYPTTYFQLPKGKSNFITYFNEAKNITVIEPGNPIAKQFPNQTTCMLKLNCEGKFGSLMLMSFPEDEEINTAFIDEVRIVIEQFINIIYNKFHYNFIEARSQQLFQLATQLHSVQKITDVLEKVYETIRLIYPTFHFHLLMTQEYEHETVPVKMIEYTGEAAQSPGTLAFINNELQIEYNDERNETNIYAPLAGKQGVYGVLQINIDGIITMVDGEESFINQFSSMVGRAVERTTLHQSSNKLASDLQTINIASHDLNLNLDQHDITETIKKHIFQSCHAEQIGIVFFDEDENDKKQPFEILTESTNYFSTEKGISFVHYMYEQIKKDPTPTLSGNFQEEGITIPYRSMMIIPMLGFDSVFGVVIVAHKTPYYFSFDKYKFIQTFIQHASLAFTNSVLKEKLKQTAITDYLTKLYSRNHLDIIIDKHMSEDCCGAFILFDIDDFKLINDTYGHYIGDKVLIQVANIIQSEMGRNEVAARWGGEEFAVYLPNCDLQTATQKANKIREKVMYGTDPQVSLSSGVSVWESSRGDTVEKLFIRTDEALYEAKSSGKNKVVQNY